MDPETIETFITKLRGSVDTLVDQLVEELGIVRDLLENGNTGDALAKVNAMISSIEESEDEE